MGAAHLWALVLVAFGLAGLGGLWAGMPMGLLLVGIAWLPGRILADRLQAGRDSDGQGLGDLLVGPGGFSVELALSLALLVPVFVPSFLLGVSLATARTSYAGVLAVLGIAGLVGAVTSRRSSERWDWIAAATAVGLLLPVVLSYAGATVDDWWDLSFVRAYIERPGLSFAEPLLGSGRVHPRFLWNSWYVVQALVLEGRVQEAVAFQAGALAVFVCIAVVSAQACLARAVFGSADRMLRAAAIGAVPLWLYGTEALPFFTRLHQDKFVAGLVLVPVLLAAVLHCQRSSGRRYVVLTFAVALATCSTHSLLFGVGMIGVAALGMCEFFFDTRSPRALNRLAAATLPLLAYPLGQALALRERFGAQRIELSSTDNPVVLAHLSLDRLLWPESAAYVVNPAAVFGPVAIIACVGAVICIRAMSDRSRRALAALTVVPTVLIFVPGIAGLVGTALVPWMVYRIGWLVPVPLLLAVVFAEAWRSHGRFVRTGLLVGFAMLLVLPLANNRLRRDMREHPTQREWGPRGTTRELYDFLATVPATAVVVADAGVSRLVPSMSGRATLAMSERATVVFSGDEATAYGRLRARADFFATDAGAARRAGLAVRYGLTHAVFRRRWISAGSENRWLRGAAGPGFALLSSTPARRTATADRELLLQSLSPDASIVFANADYFVVELSAATVGDVVLETFGTGDWSTAFDVSPPASVSKDTEVVAGAVRYPGARVYFHPPPVALGASAFPVWTSGGEVWDDAPTDVRVVLQMRGACDLEAVEVRPYLPSGRREVLELTVGDLSVRRVARHKAPIVLNLNGGRRDSIELRVRSMLGASFGLTELRLRARIGSCDAQWEPFGEPEWPQVEPSVSDGMLLARRYPHRAEATLPLANALAEADRPEDALAVLRQAISGAHPETVSWIEQGLLQDAVGDSDGALASFEAAVATDSNSAWARGCLAWAELRKRSPVSAVWHAVSAIRLDHDYADAYTILAGAAKQLGLRAAARSLLERSLVMDRYRSWGYLELARMIDEDGDREAAVGLLEEFLALVPFDSDARALLAAFSEAPAEG